MTDSPKRCGVESDCAAFGTRRVQIQRCLFVLKSDSVLNNRKNKDRYDIDLSDSGTVVKPRSDGKHGYRNSPDMWFYLGAFSEIGFSIAIPIAAGTIIGSLIDKQWATGPRATLIGLVLGLVASLLAFVRTLLTVIRHKP
jgi:ATP synthase protein I